jgi:hypothetical protein
MFAFSSESSIRGKTEITQEIVPGWTLEDAAKVSKVIVSAVPNALFKVDKRWVQHGVICINVSSDKVRTDHLVIRFVRQ